MNITSAVALAVFGHDSSRPKRKAIVLCSSLIFVSAVFGALAAVQARHASILHAWPYPYDILFALVFCLQIIMLVCLVSSRGILNTEVTTVRLLHVLPLTEFKRWLLIRMPQLFLLSIVIMVSAPALQTCISIVGLNPLWSLVIISCASLSALGLCYGLPFKGILHFGLCVASIAAEAWLLRSILDVTVTSTAKTPYYCLFSLLIASTLLSLRFANKHKPVTKQHYLNVHLPQTLWYITKVIRSYTGRTSFLFAILCTMLVMTGAIYLHQESIGFLCTTTGLVLASFCSDIRSLAAVKRPPEIVALRGTLYFVKQQMSSIIISLFAASPVIGYLMLTHATALDLLTGILMILMGAIAGLFAATVIGAKARDISSQCAAVFVSCTLFYVCSRLAALFGDGTVHTAIASSFIVLLLASSIFGVEYKRNTYMWRKNRD